MEQTVPLWSLLSALPITPKITTASCFWTDAAGHANVMFGGNWWCREKAPRWNSKPMPEKGFSDAACLETAAIWHKDLLFKRKKPGTSTTLVHVHL